MRKNHLPYLSDPLGHTSLSLSVFEENGPHVMSGLLEGGDAWYPIIGGIPRLLTGDLKTNLLRVHEEFFKRWKERLPAQAVREWQSALDSIPDRGAFFAHQKKTAESFAYEWKYIYQENDYERENFFHFAGPFVTAENIHGKATLDIGCGSGRFTKWAALSGTSVSFGSDLGETVEVAYGLTKDLENACIVQADIYRMPFRGVFDLAYSIGVLHHLPRPKQGFLALPPVLKPAGEFVIWVYNRRKNARALYFYEPLRSLLKHLPKPVLFKLSYVPGLAVHALNGLTHACRKLGLKRLGDRIPFAYYANFPFNMKLNDAFDVLATPKSNYYYVEDIRHWYAEAHLGNIRTFEHPEAGITAIGTYAR